MSTVTIELNYDEPPAPTRRKILPVLAMMTLEPSERWGQWVRVADGYTKTVANTTCQKLRHETKIPAGKWEFRYGKVEGTETYGVWARYQGPEEGK